MPKKRLEIPDGYHFYRIDDKHWEFLDNIDGANYKIIHIPHDDDFWEDPDYYGLEHMIQRLSRKREGILDGAQAYLAWSTITDNWILLHFKGINTVYLYEADEINELFELYERNKLPSNITAGEGLA